MNEEKIAGRLPMKRDYKSVGNSIIGKLRIGSEMQKDDKTGKTKAPGRAIDWFRATGEYAEQFHEIYGENPSRITIVFPSLDPLQSCNHRLEGRDNEGNLAAYYDGLNYMIYDDVQKNYTPVSETDFEKAQKIGITVTKGYGSNAKKQIVLISSWKERLTLRFFIPKIQGIMGVWELTTGAAASSIPNIITNFDGMVNAVGENINKIPFDLSVKFVTSNKPGNISKFSVLTLTPNISYENAMLLQEFAGMQIKGILNDEKIREIADRQLLALPEKTEEKLLISEPEPKIEPEPKKKEFTPDVFKEYLKEQSELLPKELLLLRELCEQFKAACKLIIVGNDGKPYQDRYFEVMKYLFDTVDEEMVTEGAAKAFIKWINPIPTIDGFTIGNKNAKKQYDMITDFLDTGEIIIS